MPRPLQRKNMRSNGRAKIPYSRRKAVGKVNLHQDVIKQNHLRGRFNSMIKQLSLKPTREIGTGVDYLHTFFIGKQRKSMKIDLKFAFGLLGDGVIKIRVRERKLINEADWVFAIDRNNQAHIFQTSALRQYVNSAWGSISKTNVINKGSYSELPVNLVSLYSTLGVKPIISPLTTEGLAQAIKKMREIQFKRKKVSPVTEKKGPIKNVKPLEQNHKQPKLVLRKTRIDKRIIIKPNFHKTVNRNR
ncbi:MAG: hypothetical protein WC821_03560 [archaeon]|jgi:hypothetical protein